MNTMSSGSSSFIIGRRATGKTTLVKDLLFHQQEIPVGTVLCGTESEYNKIVPLHFIHDECSDTVIETLVNYHKQNISPSFLILDDMLYDNNLLSNNNFMHLLHKSRQLNVNCMITTQSLHDIPVTISAATDYVFIFHDPSGSNRRRIFENCVLPFPSLEAFYQIMDQYTKDHGCIVIDNTNQSRKMEDSVYWYKAEIHPEFHIGAPDLWNFTETVVIEPVAT